MKEKIIDVMILVIFLIFGFTLIYSGLSQSAIAKDRQEYRASMKLIYEGRGHLTVYEFIYDDQVYLIWKQSIYNGGAGGMVKK